MRIGATLSPALVALLERGRLDVDYVAVNGENDLAALEGAPVLLHDIAYAFWLNHEDPFVPALMDKARTPRAEAITRESHGLSEDALAGEVALLRGLLGHA